jgi:hypothetical protein
MVGQFLVDRMSFNLPELIRHNPESMYDMHSQALQSVKPATDEAGTLELEEIKKALRAGLPVPKAEEKPSELRSIPTLVDAVTRSVGSILEKALDSFSSRAEVSEAVKLGQVKHSTNPLCRIRTRAGLDGEVYLALVTTSSTLKSSRQPFGSSAILILLFILTLSQSGLRGLTSTEKSSRFTIR